MNKSSISIAIVLVVFVLSTSFLQAQRKASPRSTENKNADSCSEQFKTADQVLNAPFSVPGFGATLEQF